MCFIFLKNKSPKLWHRPYWKYELVFQFRIDKFYAISD